MTIKPKYIVCAFDKKGAQIDQFEVEATNLRLATEHAAMKMTGRNSANGQAATKLTIELYGEVTD